MPAKKDIEKSLKDLTIKTDKCWIWQGARHHKGYGNLRGRMAHRISWEIHVGEIPDKMTIDHLCLNKLCVNPNHLEVVTNQENKRRWAEKLTHCPKGHEYSGDNLVEEHYLATNNIPTTKKRCRICLNAYQRKWQKRKRLGYIPDQDGVEVVRLGRK